MSDFHNLLKMENKTDKQAQPRQNEADKQAQPRHQLPLDIQSFVLKITGIEDMKVEWSKRDAVTELYIMIINLNKNKYEHKQKFYFFNVVEEKTMLEINREEKNENIKIFFYGVDDFGEIKVSSVFNYDEIQPETPVTLAVHVKKKSYMNSEEQYSYSHKAAKLKFVNRQMYMYYNNTTKPVVVFDPQPINYNNYNNYNNYPRVYVIFTQTECTKNGVDCFKEFLTRTTTSCSPVSIPQCLQSKERAIYKVYELDNTGSHINQSIPDSFITHNTTMDVEQKIEMADKYIGVSPKMVSFRYLYRNKPDDMMDQMFNKYKKDYNGDQASSINGQIEGLFFMVTPDRKTGLPQRYSHYGNMRINIPPSWLVQPYNPYLRCNLYFADFYCYNTAHYVLLVLTPPRSPADIYCSLRLPKLDIYNNRFMCYNIKLGEFQTTAIRQKLGEFQTTAIRQLNVEVLYTENIHHLIQPYVKVETITDIRGQGKSTPGGIPKNNNCLICNDEKIPKN